MTRCPVFDGPFHTTPSGTPPKPPVFRAVPASARSRLGHFETAMNCLGHDLDARYRPEGQVKQNRASCIHGNAVLGGLLSNETCWKLSQAKRQGQDGRRMPTYANPPAATKGRSLSLLLHVHLIPFVLVFVHPSFLLSIKDPPFHLSSGPSQASINNLAVCTGTWNPNSQSQPPLPRSQPPLPRSQPPLPRSQPPLPSPAPSSSKGSQVSHVD